MNIKKGERIAAYATIVTVVLAILKGVIGYFANSIVLIADAFHSIADSLAIFASWFGLRISSKKANKKFPYGYYKAENLATFVISLIFFYVAFEIALESYSKFFVVEVLNIPFVALSIALISSITAYFIAYYEIKIGKEINSQSLLINGQESRIDIISSAFVFVALAFRYFRVPYIESIVGFGIAILIFKIAFSNAKLSIYALMDAFTQPELENKIEKLISSTKGVGKLVNLKLRQSGPFIFGEASIEVKKNLNVKRAHEIADLVESKITKHFPAVESFNIHIEPFTKKSVKLLIPLVEKKDINSRVSPHFGRAIYFLFAIIEKNKLKKYYIKKNKFFGKPVRAGLSTVKEILKENVDAVVVKEIGEISFHTLRDALIDVYLTKGRTAKEVVDNFVKNKLKLLKKPTHSSEKKLKL